MLLSLGTNQKSKIVNRHLPAAGRFDIQKKDSRLPIESAESTKSVPGNHPNFLNLPRAVSKASTGENMLRAMSSNQRSVLRRWRNVVILQVFHVQQAFVNIYRMIDFSKIEYHDAPFEGICFDFAWENAQVILYIDVYNDSLGDYDSHKIVFGGVTRVVCPLNLEAKLESAGIDSLDVKYGEERNFCRVEISFYYSKGVSSKGVGTYAILELDFTTVLLEINGVLFDE